MEFILVRHGETMANRNKIYADSNESLSVLGKKQIELTRQRLSKTSFDKIISSPYKRAVESASILSNKQKKIECVDILKEVSLGVLEGKTFDQAFSQNKEGIQNWIDNPFDFGPEGGESLNDAMIRARDFLSFYEEDKVIFLSHEGFIRLCLCVVVGTSKAFFSFDIKNASITHISKIGNHFVIRGINL